MWPLQKRGEVIGHCSASAASKHGQTPSLAGPSRKGLRPATRTMRRGWKLRCKRPHGVAWRAQLSPATGPLELLPFCRQGPHANCPTVSEGLARCVRLWILTPFKCFETASWSWSYTHITQRASHPLHFSWKAPRWTHTSIPNLLRRMQKIKLASAGRNGIKQLWRDHDLAGHMPQHIEQT